MVIRPFRIARLPVIAFGEGTIAEVPALAAEYGRRVLVVTGERAFRSSRHHAAFIKGLRSQGLKGEFLAVSGEPTPDLVDAAVARFRSAGIDAVVGIGGGSALDAAKAVAGLLRTRRSVLDHIEGVGRGVPYAGPAVPFLAVPTTAGTGSEATRNAVIRCVGESGFKKSFRHDDLVARHAVVDPALLETCARELIAADGMDALTQLLESYASPRASPVTDALVESGLASARDGLLPWYEGSGDEAPARSRMAYASLLSGIALAQTGLGSVHGLASSLGGFFDVAHGVVCGTLVASAVRINAGAMRAREPENPALARYARAHEILAGGAIRSGGGSAEGLADLLEGWIARLGIPRLGRYGVTEADLARVARGSRGGSMNTNPVVLTDGEIAEVVLPRL